MDRLNRNRYALSVCVTATLLSGCGTSQVSSPSAPAAGTNSGMIRIVPASGGGFAGGYSGTGTWTCHRKGGSFTASGKGTVSFLGRSNESVRLTSHTHLGGCANWQGLATLKSLRNPRNYINIQVLPTGDLGYLCQFGASYQVTGGGGKFAHATGGGRWTCTLNGYGTHHYSDRWAGKLKF